MSILARCYIPLVAALISCSIALAMAEALEQSNAETNEREQSRQEEQQQQQCVPTKQCDVDEVFECCGPCYQLTCDGTVLDCDGLCYAECYCASGFVREYPGGRCIPRLFCQKPPLPILSDYDDSHEE